MSTEATGAGSASAAPAEKGVHAAARKLRRGFRIYAAPSSQPRVRRATDVLLLTVGLLGLWLLTAAYPPSGLEQSLEHLLAEFPGWLHSVWAVLYDLLWLWAIVLVLGAVIARRRFVALQSVAALVAGAVIALVCTRLAIGHWPSIGTAIEGGSDSPVYPGFRVAEAGAVVLVTAPHLTRPLRTTGWWILVLGVFSGMLIDSSTPGGNIAGFLVAVTAAAAVRLALGTSAGRPGLAEVGGALAELGVDARDLHPAERQIAGVVRFEARDPSGHELAIKVYGRDAYDNQLIAKFSRTVWYRDSGPELGLSRLQAVEHEALMTLLAARAGVQSREVVTAGATDESDALLVLRGGARQLGTLGDEIDDELLGEAWSTLAKLGAAGIAHTQIDPTTVAVDSRDVWLLDFGAATAAPTANQLQTDRVQLLSATAAVVGVERAIAAAVASLGQDGVAALLPYLQSAALATPLRKEVKAAGINVDELRKQMAAAVGAEEPELVKLRRMTWWTIIQASLLFLAASAVFSAAATVDWSVVREDLSNAYWGWILLGFIVAQTPRLTQAVGTLGSVAAKLPFGPVYMKELATCYLNLAMPSSVARMAVNIRFFQCMGLPGVMAVTSGAIDSFANNVIQVILLAILLLFGLGDVNLDLSAPSADSGAGHLVWILLGLLLVSVLVVLFVGRVRRPIVKRLKEWWPEVKTSLGALRSSNRLKLLVLGNVASELLFCAALGIFVRALGYHIPYAEIVVINESVALLSSFIPVPGGIGVVEFGLSIGLTSAGMTQESALVSVLLYRLATFYLPPIWGFFALRWLQRNKYL